MRARRDIGRLILFDRALQQFVNSLAPGNLLFAVPVESGLVSVPCGHGELLIGKGLASLNLQDRRSIERIRLKAELECRGQKRRI